MASINAVHRLEKAGIDRKTADAIMVEIENMVHDKVSTKDDLRVLKAELKEVIASSRNTMIAWYVAASAVAPVLTALVSRWVSH